MGVIDPAGPEGRRGLSATFVPGPRDKDISQLPEILHSVYLYPLLLAQNHIMDFIERHKKAQRFSAAAAA